MWPPWQFFRHEVARERKHVKHAKGLGHSQSHARRSVSQHVIPHAGTKTLSSTTSRTTESVSRNPKSAGYTSNDIKRHWQLLPRRLLQTWSWPTERQALPSSKLTDFLHHDLDQLITSDQRCSSRGGSDVMLRWRQVGLEQWYDIV